MEPKVIERSKLMRSEWDRAFSDTTMDAITQIIVSVRQEKGHSAAESKAKEIRLLIETGITESELLKQLKQMN